MGTRYQYPQHTTDRLDTVIDINPLLKGSPAYFDCSDNQRRSLVPDVCGHQVYNWGNPRDALGKTWGCFVDMRIFLKVVGYVLLILFSLDIVYIISGLASVRHSLDEMLWHFFWAAGLVALGIYLVIKKPSSVEKVGSKSRIWGVLSLVFGFIGVFWWGAVLGILAVILAILQFRHSPSKIAIAGFCLGVIDYIMAAIWHDLGLMPSIF